MSREQATENVFRASGQQNMRAVSANPMSRTLHDPHTFMEKKMRESAPYFRQTRVQTCSHIVMKGGKAVAVQFPLEKTGWKNPNSYVQAKRSSETKSLAR
jgi:hypothetical protein